MRSLKEFVLASHAATICIDHHLEAQGFADFDLIDEEATSTGEIVYRVLQQLQGPHLTRSMATNLYCAIMTDTGSFRFPRVDAEIHRIAASLLEYGADPVSVYSNVYERWSNGRIHLLGEMLAGLKSGFNGQLAYVTITREMLERTGTTEEDADNFTVYPMSIEGVKMGILFLELPEGVKISVRSKGDVPANLLAKQFNGNGHKNAAGARVYTAGLAEVQQQVVAAAGNFLSPSTIRQL